MAKMFHCVQVTAVIILFSFSYVSFVEPGNVLVVPIEGSHWLSMRPVVDLLKQKGHQIFVVAPDVSIHIQASEGYEIELYPVSYSREQLQDHIKKYSSELFIDRSFLQKFLKVRESLREGAAMMFDNCARLLKNTKLMKTLEETTFDVVLTDPMLPCGQILAEHLAVPSVFFLLSIPCHLDAKSSQCPLPLSYVPRQFTHFTDRMSFPQRLQNFFMEIASYFLCDVVYVPYQQLASEFLQREISLQEILSHAAFWLMRLDFAIDYPRPVMPNMAFIGGINCVQRKPLNQDFEKLVNSSGEHGFVVFSLGSMVSEIPMHKAMDIAEGLRDIPQTVIWRYTGPPPSNLGENTHLVKWLPQNDLLAHPKVRAFITHAGSHGIYEGICNAVPMVMLPLFGDQMDNAKRIESRGAGITLNVLELIPDDLTKALESVINIPSYKENIQRLSALHLDRPIHPLDLAVHWVEFVMRHKGAPHLRPAAHDLNWIQYHSIDVFAFLFVVLVTSLFISIKCCAFTLRCCCRRKPSKGKSKSKSKKE